MKLLVLEYVLIIKTDILDVMWITLIDNTIELNNDMSTILMELTFLKNNLSVFVKRRFGAFFFLKKTKFSMEILYFH